MLLLYHVFTSGSTLGVCFVALRSVFPPLVLIRMVMLHKTVVSAD